MIVDVDLNVSLEENIRRNMSLAFEQFESAYNYANVYNYRQYKSQKLKNSKPKQQSN